jgi:hypothetical protein
MILRNACDGTDVDKHTCPGTGVIRVQLHCLLCADVLAMLLCPQCYDNLWAQPEEWSCLSCGNVPGFEVMS